MIGYLISCVCAVLLLSLLIPNLYMISLRVWCALVSTAFDFIRVLVERVTCALDKGELYPSLSSIRTDYVRFNAETMNKALVTNVYPNRNTESFALARIMHTRNVQHTGKQPLPIMPVQPAFSSFVINNALSANKKMNNPNSPNV
jgi:hypothetical protein